jgi:hypothetical protein
MIPTDSSVVIDAIVVAAIALIYFLGRAQPATIRGRIKNRRARVVNPPT